MSGHCEKKISENPSGLIFQKTRRQRMIDSGNERLDVRSYC